MTTVLRLREGVAPVKVESDMTTTVRRPAWAGQFYPEDLAELAAVVDRCMEAAPPAAVEGRVVAALSPHAGYEYSGPCAGATYRALQGAACDLVIVVGTHYVEEEGLFLAPYDAYRSPLGEVRVAADAARRLKTLAPGVAVSPEAHADHSVEVQLPFLQRALKDFELLPLVANVRGPEEAERFGAALAEVARGRRAVLIASSDLSHYPPVDLARKIDPAALAAFLTMDASYLYLADGVIRGHAAPGVLCTLCGLGACAVVAHAARLLGADAGKLLAYANSAEAGGGEGRTVGYGAAVLLRSGRPQAALAAWPALDLSKEEGAELVALARSGLEEFLRNGRRSKPRLFDQPRFNLPAAAFVTWEEGDWKEGGLRGCIGTLEARQSLGDAVAHYAVAAATEYPGLEPIALEELGRVRAEVTVLSPLRDIRPDDIVPGLGIHVSRGWSSGVFLPQVWEKFPNKEAFMTALCRHKAGLPADAWRKPGTKLQAFTARCFQ